MRLENFINIVIGCMCYTQLHFEENSMTTVVFDKREAKGGCVTCLYKSEKKMHRSVIRFECLTLRDIL